MLRQQVHRAPPHRGQRRQDLLRDQHRVAGRRRPRPTPPPRPATRTPPTLTAQAKALDGKVADPVPGRDPPGAAADLLRLQHLRRAGPAGRPGGLRRRPGAVPGHRSPASSTPSPRRRTRWCSPPTPTPDRAQAPTPVHQPVVPPFTQAGHRVGPIPTEHRRSGSDVHDLTSRQIGSSIYIGTPLFSRPWPPRSSARPRPGSGCSTPPPLLFAERGIEAVSIDTIAEAADRTSGRGVRPLRQQGGPAQRPAREPGERDARRSWTPSCRWTATATSSSPPCGARSPSPARARARGGCCSSTSCGSTPTATSAARAHLAARFAEARRMVVDSMRAFAGRGPGRPPGHPRAGRSPAAGPARRPRDAAPHRPRCRPRRRRRRSACGPSPACAIPAEPPTPPTATPTPDRNPTSTQDDPLTTLPPSGSIIDLLADTWAEAVPHEHVRPAPRRGPGALAPRARRTRLLGGDPPRRRASR